MALKSLFFYFIIIIGFLHGTKNERFDRRILTETFQVFIFS